MLPRRPRLHSSSVHCLIGSSLAYLIGSLPHWLVARRLHSSSVHCLISCGSLVGCIAHQFTASSAASSNSSLVHCLISCLVVSRLARRLPRRIAHQFTASSAAAHSSAASSNSSSLPRRIAHRYTAASSNSSSACSSAASSNSSSVHCLNSCLVE